MKIKTITCHDVYNYGASLQAYALAHYLEKLGHDVQIINYKPEYLDHYTLTKVNNPQYRKPIIRLVYLLAKLPGRIKAKRSKRKRAFDSFTSILNLSAQKYRTNEDLKRFPPDADIYFAGSDQIWNTVFQNGRDPAFYLDFVAKDSVKASYAASFGTDHIREEYKDCIKSWLSSFDHISVREKTGIQMLQELGLAAVQVADPVFLLNAKEWSEIETPYERDEGYLFVYDFDSDPKIKEYANKLAEKKKLKICTAFQSSYGENCEDMGPLEFVNLIRKADFVISNSFHATAFAIIFHKQFVVFDRQEAINTRMHDLLGDLGLDNRHISDTYTFPDDIDYADTDARLQQIVESSKEFIGLCLSTAECRKKGTNKDIH